MKTIVIDNNPEFILTLTRILKKAFPDLEIIPEETLRLPVGFTEWENVIEFVSEISDEQAILFLDLSLKDQDFADAKRGIEKGLVIRDLKPKWIVIAYTFFGVMAQNTPGFGEAFDGILDKGEIYSRSPDENENHISKIVKRAVYSRAKKENKDLLDNVTIIDSLGMRIFQAAFNDVSIREIIDNETSGWTEITLEALTSGHSGAHMISVRGGRDNRPQSIVLKVARSAGVIENEIRALEGDQMSGLGPLAPYIIPLDPTKVELDSDIGVYYRQPHIQDGRPLLTLLKEGSWPGDKIFIDPLVELCLKVFQSVELAKGATSPIKNKFQLTPLDISRLQSSMEFLAEFGHTLQERDGWSGRASPEQIIADVSQFAIEWLDVLCPDFRVWQGIQHGDLNPGNVLILSDSTPRLIDLARFGSWPIGYDLSRLALMIRLRIVDASGHSDWFPESFEKICCESVALIDGPVDINAALCPEAVYCDQSFYQYLDTVPARFRGLLSYGYKLGTLWDLIKIISYQDISPFKRMWALLETWELKNRLDQPPDRRVLPV